MMPFLVAVITAVLCVCLIFWREATVTFAQKLGHWLGADFNNREMKHNPAISAEAVMLLWMVLCVSWPDDVFWHFAKHFCLCAGLHALSG